MDAKVAVAAIVIGLLAGAFIGLSIRSQHVLTELPTPTPEPTVASQEIIAPTATPQPVSNEPESFVLNTVQAQSGSTVTVTITNPYSYHIKLTASLSSSEVRIINSTFNTIMYPFKTEVATFKLSPSQTPIDVTLTITGVKYEF